jgi:hypothetical protein
MTRLGDSYEDFQRGNGLNRPKTGFCLDCGLELSPNEHTYCLKCEHIYQEWQESLLNDE